MIGLAIDRNHINHIIGLILDPFSNRYVIPYFHKYLLIFLLLFNVICCTYSVDSYIIFANRKDIRRLDESTLSMISSSHHRRMNGDNITILIDQLEDATAIDFDYQSNLLFWTDLGLETIKSFDLNDRRVSDVISTGIESPESLACDWITRKLYWIDSETKHIDVSNYDGSQRTVLFWKDLDQPRTIVLVPSRGLMFWSDWGEIAKIERASMDGNQTTRKVIIEKDLTWPNGLTVDYETNRLYFADANRKYIASCDFDGKNLKTIVSNVSQIFALTFNENLLYWTLIQNANNDHSKNGIYFYNILSEKFGTPYSRPDHNPSGITVFNAKRQPQSLNPCKNNNGGCSHLCLLSSESSAGYSCACPTGIRLESDGKTCPSRAQNILLLARKFDIRRISLDTNDYTPVVLPIKNLKQVVAIDYDPFEEKIYWTDDELHAIKRAMLNGSQYETIISTDIVYPEGLAIDWIARNIYWIDSAIDHIEVARLDTAFRKVLINTDVDQPRAIVVHPLEGYIFWSDWGNQSKIERASLDGSNRVAIINSSITWPNGLAIDYELSHIYWCDAKTKAIEMSRFDGSNRTIIKTIERSHMYDLTLFDQWIYWTDWIKRTVERAHKLTGNDLTVVIENLPDLMGLKAVSLSRPSGTNPCGQQNGNCSQLCFNRPHQQFVCACSDGYEMNEDGRTCTKAESFIYLLREKDITRISLKTRMVSSYEINHASSFDVDVAENRMYWTDHKNKRIMGAYLNGSKPETIVQIGLESPRCLALDWISHNLYWIDDSDLKRIEVSRSNGQFRRVVFHDANRKPYLIIVNPVDGHLFWSDWSMNGNRIVMSFLDGSKIKKIAESKEKILSLSVDHQLKRLFWISQDDPRIMASSYDGSSKLSFNLSVAHRPISLAINDDFLYFLNRDAQTIEYVNKLDLSNRSLLEKNELFATANQLLIHDSIKQKGWNLCADQNGGCEHLCLVKTNQKQDSNNHCSCASHYKLDPENKKCLPPETFLLLSQKNLISRFLFDPEKTRSDFQEIALPIGNLKNIKSLAYDQLDHYVYFIDGKTIKRAAINGQSIEPVLSSHSFVQPVDLVIDPYARILFWTCNITNSINVTRIIGKPIMVGSVHHSNYDQPRLLAYHLGTNSLFWTNHIQPPRIERITFPFTNKTTVVKDNLYDVSAITVDQELNQLIWFDAIKNIIEYSSLYGSSRLVLYRENVSSPISMAAYDKYLFWIEKDRKTVEKLPLILYLGNVKQTIFIKDHVLTDIIAVPLMKKNSSHLYCTNENGGCSHFCFLTNQSESFVCDCPQGLMLANEEPARNCVEKVECHENEFQCRMGKCIQDSLRCNRKPDCPDGSDELDCPNCLPNQLVCFNKAELSCLDRRYFCDGNMDCSNGFDELCCGPDKFICNGNNCLNIKQLCDGKKDCIDGEDEYPQNCRNASVTASPPPSTSVPIRSYSYSFILLVVFFALISFVYFYYQCRRYSDKDDKEIGANDILMVERMNVPGNARNNRNPHKKTNGFLNSNLLRSDCNTLTTTTTISGLDTLRPDVPMNEMAAVNPSLVCQSNRSESLMERNVTGASSTSSSANINYAREAINPPPSPATERSQCSTLSSSLFVARPRNGRNKVFGGSNKNRKKGYKKKSSSKSGSNRCPPPTPYSTDVYDEPCNIKYVFYDNTQTEMDEYEYKPPPPTPRNYFSDPSCPPSPVTERSYCNPYPPPPSPVQDYE